MSDQAATSNAQFGPPIAIDTIRQAVGKFSKPERPLKSSAGIGDKVRRVFPGSDKEEPAQPAMANELAGHITGLRRYALLLVGNSVDADDLVQETLTKVLTQLQRWHEVRDLRSYLFAALHNVHIDAVRRHSKLRNAVPIDEAAALLSSPATQQKRLELRDLTVALGKLPLEQREAVLLVGYEGMSYAEAAAALSVPIGTVMSRLSRGREALRQMTHRKPQAKLRVVK